jgi:hypothetical protein
MSMDVTEVKTDVKHLTHRVSKIEDKMLGSTKAADDVYAITPARL